MTAHTLLLRIAAPLQSWGTRSRFAEYDTHLRPTKSGTLGMIAAAQGRDRTDDISDLAQLRFAVRGDRPGTPVREYHTAGGGTYPLRPLDLITDHRRAAAADPTTCRATGPAFGYTAGRALDRWYGAPKYIAPDPATGVLLADKAPRTSLQTIRYYLADAAFVVALQHDDQAALTGIASALERPKRLIWLGRKSCPPAGEMVQGVHTGTVEQVLADTELLPNASTQAPWTWIEAPTPTPGGLVVNDQPITYDPIRRTHAPRKEHRARITPGITHGWSDLL